MKASRADLIRLGLELVMALILIAALTLGNQSAQAENPQVFSQPAPGDITLSAPQAPQVAVSTAELMAIEMSALNPPLYFTDVPIIIR